MSQSPGHATTGKLAGIPCPRCNLGILGSVETTRRVKGSVRRYRKCDNPKCGRTVPTYEGTRRK